MAAAQASDATIRSAIKTAVPKIQKSQNKVLKGLTTYQSTHNPTALIKAVKSQNKALNALETKLMSQSGSTANGKKGKADVVKGLRLIVGSNNTLAKELRQSAHHAPVSKAKLKAATAADVKGNRDLNAGTKLLKL
ncbi:MAG TPA: hypothetical protein VHV28_16240 [Solirubrobacteraceae bacterium]|nr:hypothetical protein [Solirubrobacteraceae bacterium]